MPIVPTNLKPLFGIRIHAELSADLRSGLTNRDTAYFATRKERTTFNNLLPYPADRVYTNTTLMVRHENASKYITPGYIIEHLMHELDSLASDVIVSEREYTKALAALRLVPITRLTKHE